MQPLISGLTLWSISLIHAILQINLTESVLKKEWKNCKSTLTLYKNALMNLLKDKVIILVIIDYWRKIDIGHKS